MISPSPSQCHRPSTCLSKCLPAPRVRSYSKIRLECSSSRTARTARATCQALNGSRSTATRSKDQYPFIASARHCSRRSPFPKAISERSAYPVTIRPRTSSEVARFAAGIDPSATAATIVATATGAHWKRSPCASNSFSSRSYAPSSASPSANRSIRRSSPTRLALPPPARRSPHDTRCNCFSASNKLTFPCSTSQSRCSWWEQRRRQLWLAYTRTDRNGQPRLPGGTLRPASTLERLFVVPDAGGRQHVSQALGISCSYVRDVFR